jgi:hypothetical protein
MTSVKGTTRAQTIFLRSFRKNPAGPPADQWPSVTILRRWLRRRAFRAALESLRDTYRFQTDFQLAAAAAAASQILAAAAATGAAAALTPDDRKKLCELLRLAHQRQRFPADYNNLQSPSRPALYTDSDRLNLDPCDDKDEMWIIPEPRKRRRKRRATPKAPQTAIANWQSAILAELAPTPPPSR